MSHELTPCPNQGRCGTPNHRIGSEQYNECMKACSSGGSAVRGGFVPIAPILSAEEATGTTPDGWPAPGTHLQKYFPANSLNCNNDEVGVINGPVIVTRIDDDRVAITTTLEGVVPERHKEDFDFHINSPSFQRDLSIIMTRRHADFAKSDRLNKEIVWGEGNADMKGFPLSWNGETLTLTQVVYPEREGLGDIQEYLGSEYGDIVGNVHYEFTNNRNIIGNLNLIVAKHNDAYNDAVLHAVSIAMGAHDEDEDLVNRSAHDMAPETRAAFAGALQRCFDGIDVEACAAEKGTTMPAYLSGQLTDMVLSTYGGDSDNIHPVAYERWSKMPLSDMTPIVGDDGQIYFE